jgi:hypothetical protein
MKIHGCKIASQSRSLTGILTGTERWRWCGDAHLESSRSGKPLLTTLEAEAERLARSIERLAELLG